jgi:hypothetical protein
MTASEAQCYRRQTETTTKCLCHCHLIDNVVWEMALIMLLRSLFIDG